MISKQSKYTTLAALLLLSVSFSLLACDKGDSGEGEEVTVEWPAQPEDGTPIVVQFLEMSGEAEDLVGNVRVFNFSEQAIQGINSMLNYYDEAGQQIEDFPWGISGPSTVSASGVKDHEVGAFVPANTVRVEMVVNSITYQDGSNWTAPE